MSGSISSLWGNLGGVCSGPSNEITCTARRLHRAHLTAATGGSWADELGDLPTARESFATRCNGATADAQPRPRTRMPDLDVVKPATSTRCRTEAPVLVRPRSFHSPKKLCIGKRSGQQGSC